MIVISVTHKKLNKSSLPTGLFLYQIKLDLELIFLCYENGDGFINRQELGYVMENLGENMDKEEIEGLIDEIDIDGDGQINYEEFYP